LLALPCLLRASFVVCFWLCVRALLLRQVFAPCLLSLFVFPANHFLSLTSKMPRAFVDIDNGNGCISHQRVDFRFQHAYNLANGGGAVGGCGCRSRRRHAQSQRAVGVVAAMMAPIEPMPEPLEIAMAPIPLYACAPVQCCAPPCPAPVLSCGPPPPLPPNCKVIRRELVQQPCAAPCAPAAVACCPPAPLTVVSWPRNVIEARSRCWTRRAC